MGEIATLPTSQPAELSQDIVEALVLDGDLGKMRPAQRVAYYVHRCRMLGIDPGEQPFQLIKLNGKLTLYATKTCANALTRANRLSVEIKRTTFEGSLVIVEARASDPSGRFADDVGVIDLDKESLSKANALMKCATKAKRRAILALVGLGLLDVSEVEDIRGAQQVRIDVGTGEIGPDQVPVDAIDTTGTPQRRGDLGPRCSGKSVGIAEGNDRRIGELAELVQRDMGTIWRAALQRAAIDLEKYVEADGEQPCDPWALTVDDGKRLREWLDGAIAKKRGPESSESGDPNSQTAQSASVRKHVIETYDHLCNVGECTREAWRDSFAAWAGLESWPDQPSDADWHKCAEGLGRFTASLEAG